MKITNEHGFPQPMVDAATKDYKYRPKRYSVTGIIKGTCESILSRRHADEITVDVSDMVWAIFGSALHKVLEESQETADEIKEGKLEMRFGEYTLSGIFDVYDYAAEMVTDYKTTSVFKLKNGEFDDWRKQLALYCLLLRTNGFPASKGRIVAFARDHRPGEAKTQVGYPRNVEEVRWTFTDADLEAVRQETAQRFREIEEQERLTDDELTPCSPAERWERPTRWAVMKGTNKRAVHLYDTEQEAADAAESLNTLDKKAKALYWVEKRPGANVKCAEYCNCAQWCRFYRENVKGADNAES